MTTERQHTHEREAMTQVWLVLKKAFHTCTQSNSTVLFLGRHGGCALNRMATIVRVCSVNLMAHLSQTNFHPSGALERSYLSRSVLNCLSLLSMYLDDKPPSFQSVRRVCVCERERERERERISIGFPLYKAKFLLTCS